jgi:hypothetical protein
MGQLGNWIDQRLLRIALRGSVGLLSELFALIKVMLIWSEEVLD